MPQHIDYELDDTDLLIVFPSATAIVVEGISNDVELLAALDVITTALRDRVTERLTPAPDAHLESAYEEMTEQEQEDFDHGFNDIDNDPDPYQGTYSED